MIHTTTSNTHSLLTDQREHVVIESYNLQSRIPLTEIYRSVHNNLVTSRLRSFSPERDHTIDNVGVLDIYAEQFSEVVIQGYYFIIQHIEKFDNHDESWRMKLLIYLENISNGELIDEWGGEFLTLGDLIEELPIYCDEFLESVMYEIFTINDISKLMNTGYNDHLYDHIEYYVEESQRQYHNSRAEERLLYFRPRYF